MKSIPAAVWVFIAIMLLLAVVSYFGYQAGATRWWCTMTRDDDKRALHNSDYDGRPRVDVYDARPVADAVAVASRCRSA